MVVSVFGDAKPCRVGTIQKARLRADRWGTRNYRMFTDNSKPIRNAKECAKALAAALKTHPDRIEVYDGILRLIAAFVLYGESRCIDRDCRD